MPTQDHPNIIKIYGLQEDGKYFYIITELIRGKELFDYFKAKQKLTEKEVFNIFHQVLLALNHLHANHIMHRYFPTHQETSNSKTSSTMRRPKFSKLSTSAAPMSSTPKAPPISTASAL